MIKVTGKHNTALCFTDDVDEKAYQQIKTLCDQVEFEDCKIRIMPDVHAGMGCTIGTTMTITDKIVPAMVGVDIGCGIETIKLSNRKIDYTTLDNLIRKEIPSGTGIRKYSHNFNQMIDLKQLKCSNKVKLDRAEKSIGSLGGGNHFIEVAQDGQGFLYLLVHSGSRHLGNEVAMYYKNLAIKKLQEEAIKKEERVSLPRDLSYLSGKLFSDYLHDMKIVQEYAALNRQAICEVIMTAIDLEEVERFTTIHNYVDIESMILRKGAVSAQEAEMLLIPLNMKEGSFICQGKGNKDWNYSAPHGAGRLLSRTKALETLSLQEYKDSMQGIFTTSVSRKTLDEAPLAYKSAKEIVKHIDPSVEIIDKIKPTYNFKAPG